MTTVSHECYVSLEVAKLLKEVGFDWECREYYYNFTTTGWSLSFDDNFVNWNNWSEQYKSAPTLDIAQRWLREVKGWEAQVAYGFDEDGHKTYVTECGNPKGDLENYIVYFSTYEEALEACIKRALELILEKGE